MSNDFELFHRVREQLRKRWKHSITVGEIKALAGRPILDSAVQQKIIENYKSKCEGFDPEGIEDFVLSVLDYSRVLQRVIKEGWPGEQLAQSGYPSPMIAEETVETLIGSQREHIRSVDDALQGLIREIKQHLAGHEDPDGFVEHAVRDVFEHGATEEDPFENGYRTALLKLRNLIRSSVSV